MKSVFIGLGAVLSVFGSLAQAQSDRLALLTGSHLMLRYTEYLGACETQIHENAVVMACRSDGGVSDVRIEILERYDPNPFASLSERYLADRAAYCSKLVADRAGRCIGTDAMRPRPALEGLRSLSQEAPDLLRLETVVFYGPDMLRATLVTTHGDVPTDVDALLQQSLVRLTPFW